MNTPTVQVQVQVRPPLWTRYMSILVAAEKISMVYGFFAWFFTALLLAGFLVLPGTFEQLQKNGLARIPGFEKTPFSKAPFAYVGFGFTGVGVGGMMFLWRRWRDNYAWLTQKLFLPGLANSAMGLIAIFVNLYGGGKRVSLRELSTLNKVTILVTGGVGAVCRLLFLFYSGWMLSREKKTHKDIRGGHGLGQHGGGII